NRGWQRLLGAWRGTGSLRSSCHGRVLALWKRRGVVERACLELRFDAREHLLHSLPVGWRIGKQRLLPTPTSLVAKVEEQQAVVLPGSNTTHGAPHPWP